MLPGINPTSPAATDQNQVGTSASDFKVNTALVEKGPQMQKLDGISAAMGTNHHCE